MDSKQALRITKWEYLFQRVDVLVIVWPFHVIINIKYDFIGKMRKSKPDYLLYQKMLCVF